MIWFTSDLHFGHANVLTFSNRPWDDINHMNTAVIANINSLVNTNDHLYILGDFSFKITAEEAARAINGNKAQALNKKYGYRISSVPVCGLA